MIPRFLIEMASPDVSSSICRAGDVAEAAAATKAAVATEPTAKDVKKDAARAKIADAAATVIKSSAKVGRCILPPS